MTPAGPPPDPTLLAWRHRFPDRDLWPARLRLWRVELPVRTPPAFSLGEWIRKATADGDSVDAAARRLGLPPRLVRAMSSEPVGRRSFAVLDLPAGPYPVAVPPVTFPPWPDPTAAVPSAVLRPPGVEVVPMTTDWRTVPIVRAEAADVVMVRSGDRVDVYPATDPQAPPLWQLPADQVPRAEVGPD